MTTQTRQHRIPHSTESESFMRKYWRPLCAIVYLTIVLFDFLIAPILLGVYSIYTKSALQQWQPLTVQGGAIFHLSFGAILGISSWTRGNEIRDNNRYIADYNISQG